MLIRLFTENGQTFILLAGEIWKQISCPLTIGQQWKKTISPEIRKESTKLWKFPNYILSSGRHTSVSLRKKPPGSSTHRNFYNQVKWLHNFSQFTQLSPVKQTHLFSSSKWTTTRKITYSWITSRTAEIILITPTIPLNIRTLVANIQLPMITRL